jgi:hypothetical protein
MMSNTWDTINDKEFWDNVKRHANGSFVFEYDPSVKFSPIYDEKGRYAGGHYCPYVPVMKDEDDV